MNNTFKLKTHIDESIKVGDTVRIFDGSGLTPYHKDYGKQYLIGESYYKETGLRTSLMQSDAIVLEAGVSDYISIGVLNDARVQDIVIQIGGLKLRTCSQFVRKVNTLSTKPMETEIRISNIDFELTELAEKIDCYDSVWHCVGHDDKGRKYTALAGVSCGEIIKVTDIEIA